MTDRIFDDRLKQKSRDQTIECVRINFLFEAQAFAKASLLNFKVAIHKFQFLAQGHFLLLGLAQSQTQQFAEGSQSGFGLSGISAEQSGDRVQAVEQEMRLQLSLQSTQAGPGEVGFKKERSAL